MQGFAAVSQAFCHANKTEPVQHAELSAHTHSHDGHHADATPSKLNHACGHCAQCCAGYAMVSFDHPNFPLMATKAVLVEIKPVLHGSVLSPALERPPRSLIV